MIVIESLSYEKENIIKDVRSRFRLKRELHFTAIKDIRNLFRRKKGTKAIKDRILRDINNISEHKEKEKKDYKSVKVGNFWSNNYTE